MDRKEATIKQMRILPSLSESQIENWASHEWDFMTLDGEGPELKESEYGQCIHCSFQEDDSEALEPCPGPVPLL